jgi:hypothetical protein
MEKALALASGLCAILAFLLGFILRGKSEGKATDATKHEEVKRAIEKTPAADLVDTAANAGELRSDIGAIAGKFRERLRDRAGKILSGTHRVGPDDGG